MLEGACELQERTRAEQERNMPGQQGLRLHVLQIDELHARVCRNNHQQATGRSGFIIITHTR